jgi:2-methylcitrate dehydratase PrpD
LAADGFEGPRTVLEGEFGFLKVFCTKWDEAELIRGLGEDFLVSTTVLKRYPCHATAYAAVRAVRDLQAAHGFAGADVETITVTGTERMVERHNILEPADLMLAQYSIPFCVALALHREARNPESWDESALRDPQIRALCRRVRLVPEPSGEHAGMASTVTIELADGRRLEGRTENGMLEPGELEDKFRRLTRRALGQGCATALFRATTPPRGRAEPAVAWNSAVALSAW